MAVNWVTWGQMLVQLSPAHGLSKEMTGGVTRVGVTRAATDGCQVSPFFL